MGKRSVTPGRDMYEHHPVVMELGKARAAAELLNILGCGNDYIQLGGGTDEERDATRSWLVVIGEDALRAALHEAEAAFRQSVTPEQALAQIVGRSSGTKAVA